MVKYSEAALDRTFGALADPTRRAILARLSGEALPVSELAQPFAMSLPAISKHLGVLADAGLVSREKQGRQVWCRLTAGPMKNAAQWMSVYRQFWDERLDALARYVEEEGQSWHQSRKNRHSRSSATLRAPRKKSGARSRNRKR